MTFASGSGAIVLSGGTINLAGTSTITVDNTTNTISSILTGAATSFTKAGTGILELTNTNTYIGTTNINKGTLLLSGASGAIASSGAINVGNAVGPAGVLTLDNSVTGNADRVGSGAMTLRNGTLNFIGNTSAASLETIGTITAGTGHNLINLSGGAVGQVAELISTAGAISRTAGATMTIVADGTNQQFKFTGGSAGINKGVFFGATAATANEFAYYPGSGGAVVAPTYGVTTNFQAETSTALTASKHNKLNGSIASQAAVSIYSLNMPSNFSLTALSGNLTFTNAADQGAIIKSGGGAAQIGTAGNAFDIVGVNSGELVFNTVAAADNLTLNVGITNTSTALTKTGAGTLTLTANRDYLYTGATTVNAGTLVVNGLTTGTASAGGFRSSITVNNGGTLKFGSSNKMIRTAAITVNAGGIVDVGAISTTFGALTLNQGGTITGTTGVFLTTGLVANNGGTISGFSGAGQFGVYSGTAVTYNSTSATSTMLSIDRVTLSGGAGRAFVIADGNDPSGVDFDITEWMGNGSNITKSGAGVMRLSGSTVNDYTGTVGINDGTLLLNKSAAALAMSGTGLITVGDGSGTAGSAILRYSSTGSNNQILNNAITINSDGLFDLNGKTDTVGALTVNSTGQLQLNNGSLTITTLAITPLAGNTTMLSLGSSGTLTLGGNVTFTAATNGRAQITGNSLNLGGATRTFTVNLGSGADYDLLIDSVIAVTGNFGLIKAGNGRLTLTNTNTYTGSTTISAGTLNVNKSSALGNEANANNTLIFNGGTLQAGGIITSAATRGVTMTSTGIIDTNGNAVSIAGIISGTGGLTKIGLGDLDLTNTNTYTGVTNINAGAIKITDMRNLGSGGVGNSVGINGGTLVSTANTYALGTNRSILLGAGPNTIQVDADTLTVDGVISGVGNLTKTGVGALTVSNTNTYSGSTTVSAGKLNVASAAPSGADGALGNATSDVVLGDANTLAGDAPSLLVNGAFTVGRNITVGSVANAAAYNAIIGGSNTSGVSTFSGNITLNTTAANYTVTLQAATGGTVHFTSGTWATNNKAINIGTSGNLGTVRISNNISTSGGVSVNFGTLELNGTLTGDLTALAGTTLSGTGTITGATIINGTHSPGTSPGIQTFGNLTYGGAPSVVNWELTADTSTNAANPNAIFDQIVVTGNLDFGTDTDLNLTFNGAGSTVNWGDIFWLSNQSWMLYDVTGTTSNFSNFSLNTINWLDGNVVPLDFDTALPSSSFSLSQVGEDVFLNYTVAAIPEPGRMMLLFFGLAALFLRRRR